MKIASAVILTSGLQNMSTSEFSAAAAPILHAFAKPALKPDCKTVVFWLESFEQSLKMVT
jgi:hypothetical protein